ncbi:P27 family phage terminase small subunit [Bradyrhizobium sp. Pha-3]|uniref:P27 family phage terminase small subunit n=1 Tax=Bradyrhizobium sp. Pha-3 TaxID=208375 RepID=UPI0035D52940
MKGTKPNLQADPDAIGDMKPPTWLSKFAKAEFRRVMPDLSVRRILTTADLGSLESYCIAIGRVRELEVELRKGFDPKLWRAQNQAMVTARQLAAELGLTPVSRARPSVRENESDADSLVD